MWRRRPVAGAERILTSEQARVLGAPGLLAPQCKEYSPPAPAAPAKPEQLSHRNDMAAFQRVRAGGHLARVAAAFAQSANRITAIG